jgi:hypothetical protein
VTSWFRKHGLSLVLIGIFSMFTAATLFLGYPEYTTDATRHREAVTTSGFLEWWFFEYAMSLVADVFGAILLVTLTKRLREEGSAESQ